MAIVVKEFLEDETILDDNYPVNWDYIYIVDGRITRSDVRGTVRDLRRDLISQGKTANEVRRCNLAERIKQQEEGKLK